MLKSKICRICYTEKNWSEFHNHKRKLDGKSNMCKLCTKDYNLNRIKTCTPISENECTGCKRTLPVSEFHKNKGKGKGIESRCKVCRNNKIVEKRYGLKKGQLQQMKKVIDFKCELCENKTPLAVDHCHKKGHVRGLLCSKCNTGLGQFNDDIELMKKAIKYLEER